MDPFGTTYSPRSGGRSSRNSRPDDCVHELDCTLEDLYNGNIRKVRISRHVTCRECKGKRCQPGVDCRCRKCRGTGIEQQFVFLSGINTPCSMCNGTGEYITQKNRCHMCHGNGYVKEIKSWEVKIPCGGENGDTIRLKNAGDCIHNKTADVIFVIHEKPHSVFERSHSTLCTQLTITLAEALCGFTKSITTLDNRQVLFTSPKGSIINVSEYLYENIIFSHIH